MFLGENLFRLGIYISSGLITREVLLFGAASVPAAALAMALAGALGPRMREERLQMGAIALFLLGGVSIIIKSIVFHT